VDRQHPFLKELHWHIECEQSEHSVTVALARARQEVAGLDLLVAEQLMAGLVCRELRHERGLPYVFDMHGLMKEEARLTDRRNG
jgi:hypothetical protein